MICLLLIFISIYFFITLIIKNISYLQPHRAIFLLSTSFNYEDLRDYLWKKYPLEPPYDLRVRIDFDIEEDNQKTEEEKRTERKKKEEEDDRKLEAIENEIAAIKKQNILAEDPLLSIRDMMIQFIRRADLSSLTEAQELLLSISRDFIDKIPKNTNQDWSPNIVLLINITQYLIELLSTLLEIAEKEGLESAKKVVLNVSYGYSEMCFKKSAYRELELVHEFLKKVADTSIGKSSFVFQSIMEHYQSIGEKTFDLLVEEPKEPRGDNRLNVLDNIFRYVGWLGERLLMKLPLEESPLMSNYDYNTEYDALLNCLLTFSHRYDREQPRAYPLIYFDALYVVLKQIVRINQRVKVQHLDENTFDIVFAFDSFAEEAIQVGNSEGAALAAIRLKEAYEEIRRAGINNLANDTIKLLVRIGRLAAGNKEYLHPVPFMSTPLDVWAADNLVRSGASIEREVSDCYIHIYEVKNRDAVWDFITKLGMRLGSNFGLAFDPATGKTYPEGDLRRR